MKTAEKFYNELAGSEELRKEYDAIADIDSLAQFIKKYDCTATPE